MAIAAHDRENPTHTAYGIGLAHFDMERLGFEEGEQILPGITIQSDSGVSGNFRVLCDAEHDEELVEAEEEIVEAVASRSVPGLAPETRESDQRRDGAPAVGPVGRRRRPGPRLSPRRGSARRPAGRCPRARR